LSNEEVQQSVSVYVAAESDPNVTLADFKIHKVIGRGSFGKVYLV
jgi:serine/threonine protein kinase